MIHHRLFKLALTPALLVAEWASAQGPPSSIVAKRVPPIPAALKARMNQYLSTRAAMFADWHPTRPSILGAES